MLTVTAAVSADAHRLCRVAAAAFTVDETFKPPGAVPGGPPGHDCLERHRAWIRQWDYYKICRDYRVVGGCIVIPQAGRLELFGLFVDAAHMGRGIGGRLLRAVMARYPDDHVWTLETPDYSIGTHRFYERFGFRPCRRSSPDPSLGFGFVTYQRKPAHNCDAPEEKKRP